MSGGLKVRATVAVARPIGAGANPPPPGRRGGGASAAIGSRPRPGPGRARTPVTPFPEPAAPFPARGSVSGPPAARPPAGNARGGGSARGAGTSADAPAGGGAAGDRRARAAGTNAPAGGAAGDSRAIGDGRTARDDSQSATAAPTRSCVSNRSCHVPSTLALNATAPVATSTTLVVMRRRSPTRCSVPSTNQLTPRSRQAAKAPGAAAPPVPDKPPAPRPTTAIPTRRTSDATVSAIPVPIQSSAGCRLTLVNGTTAATGGCASPGTADTRSPKRPAAAVTVQVRGPMATRNLMLWAGPPASTQGSGIGPASTR